jgi:drug/metabolite transporter (DMT)-like permease
VLTGAVLDWAVLTRAVLVAPMSGFASALALLAAAGWGATDFLGGLGSRAAGAVLTLFTINAVGTPIALALLPFAGEPPGTAEAITWAVVAGVTVSAGVTCLFLALSRGAMGLVSPLAGLTGAAIPAIVGIARGDPIGPVLAVGMLVALAAVVVISLPADAGGTPTVPTRHGSRAAIYLLIVAGGLGSAGFYLALDRAMTAGLGAVSALAWVRVAAVIVLGAVLLARLCRNGRVARPRMRLLLLVGGLGAITDTVGTLGYIIAATVGTLSVTVVLASLYPVGTALLARVVLHERLSPVRILGVALAILGAMLIGLSGVSG